MKRLSLRTDNKQAVIDETINVLESGGLVIFPSDTVYGLLVDACNKQAVEKLIEFKKRPKGKPISIFTSGLDMIEKYACVSDDQLARLQRILPGPFTVVLPSKHKTSLLLESEKGTLGVRYINFDLVTALIKQFGRPTTATSANVSGRAPHHSVSALLNSINAQQKNLIDHVVDAGQLPHNEPSTVIDYSQGDLTVLRKGSGKIGTSSNHENKKTKNQKGTKSIVSKSPRQTYEAGKSLGDYIVQTGEPATVLLYGDLGAGKTVFVKGIASAFGIADIVSPTYVVLYEYEIKGQKLKSKNKKEKGTNVKNDELQITCKRNVNTFVHADLYNVQDEEEFEHIGLSEYLAGHNVVCIEWGEKIKSKGKIAKGKKEIEVFIRQLDAHEREIIIA